MKSKEVEELKMNRKELIVLEQHIEILMMVLKRIFKENLKAVYTSSAMDGKTEDDLSKFKESMNILNLSPDQLKNFISTNNQKKSSFSIILVDEAKNQMEEEMEKFENELDLQGDFNGQRIFKMISEVIEDRIHLPSK